MEHWTGQHGIVAVESFIKTESVTAIQRGFRQQFQRHDAPSHNTLSWVSKWHQEGSVKDSIPQGRPFTASTPDNAEWVRDAMLQSLHRSARRPALALHLNECSLHRILHKDLHYHPYKIQDSRELSAWDQSSGLCLQADSFLVLGTSPGLPARPTLQ